MHRTNAGADNLYEVDLVQLFRVVWFQKWLIAIVTFVFASVAAVYVFSAAPVYEAKFIVAPPKISDIAELNSGRTEDLGLTKFTAEEVFKIFLGELQSQEMRQSFFQSVYFPGLDEYAHKKSDRTYSVFSQSVVVSPFDKEGLGRWSVSIQGAEPLSITKNTNLYVEEAVRRAKQEVLKRVNRQLSVLNLDLQVKIKRLRALGERERQDTIVRLDESLSIAKAAGLDNPFASTGDSKSQSQMGDSVSYMRGTKILEAELKVVAARSNNDPFIPGLRDLQTKLESYEALINQKPQMSVFDESSLIKQPAAPIKSKKMFIVLLGIAFGAMTGLVIALLRGGRMSTEAQTD